jgi:class 3 adenylate cyclase
MKRKIAAILAADAVEYSRLVAEDEEETLRLLVASFGVFRASVEGHGGRVFNTAGDAILAEFQSAVEAVRSAIDIQQTLSGRNAASAPGRRMLFRIGISIGDVVENDGDLLGDGVNIAARLQGLSRPGGLAISKWVQEQVSGKVGIEFKDAGFQSVKNMPAPIHVFHSHIAPPVPAEPETLPVRAEDAAPARGWPVGALVAALAVLMIGVGGYLALSRRDPPPVAHWQDPPPSATPEQPAAANPSPAALTPAPQPRQDAQPAQPEQSPAPKTEPASEIAATPPPSTPLPSTAQPPAAAAEPAPTPAAVPAPAVAPIPSLAATPDRPVETAVPPVSPPVANTQPAAPRLAAPPAEAAQPGRPAETPASTPPATAQDERASDPKRQKVRCAEVLERAQLGDLTSDDRAFLRSKCR